MHSIRAAQCAPHAHGVRIRQISWSFMEKGSSADFWALAVETTFDDIIEQINHLRRRLSNRQCGTIYFL